MIHSTKHFIKHQFNSLGKKDIRDSQVKYFVDNVLDTEKNYYSFLTLELIRKKNLQNFNKIEVTDLGAGSKKLKSTSRRVSDIAKYSLKSKHIAAVLFRLVHHYKKKNVLELGTSLGLTTAYLAQATKRGTVTTIEGCKEISSIARQNLSEAQVNNVNILNGEFSKVLEDLKSQTFDFVYIDGNHSYEPTVEYVNWAIEHSTDDAIIVMDDIYWNKEMTKAWQYAKEKFSDKMMVDIFEIGIIFLDEDYEGGVYKFRI